MKKRISAILIAFVMLVSSFAVAAYAETSPYVYISGSFMADGYITGTEFSTLNARGAEVETIYGYAVMVAVIDENLIGDFDSAESLYYQMTDNSHGLLLVHDICNEDIYYFLAGDCKAVFGSNIERILAVYDEAETYYGGIEAYYLEVEDAVTAFNSISDENVEGSVVTDGSISDDNGVNVDESLNKEDASTQVVPAMLDDAQLLNDAEHKAIEKKFRAFSKEYGFELVGVSVTAEDIGNMAVEDYADELYSVFKDDGVKDVAFCIYLHGGEGEREVVVVRYGKAKKELSDSDCEKIIGNVKSDFANQKYADGFNGFVQATEKVLHPTVHWIWIPVCLALGFVIAFAVMKIIASANKSVRKKVNAADYVDRSSLAVTNAADIFLYSNVQSTPKANTSSSNTSGGGRSTSSGKF